MGARILIVDDEETIREIETALLSAEGYECMQASDGEKALAILNSGEKFDLVISDVLMPGMDGFTLLGKVKKRYPELPVVIQCSSSNEDWIDMARTGGAYDYLLVPFERKELFDMVRRALASARSDGANGLP